MAVWKAMLEDMVRIDKVIDHRYVYTVMGETVACRLTYVGRLMQMQPAPISQMAACYIAGIGLCHTYRIDPHRTKEPERVIKGGHLWEKSGEILYETYGGIEHAHAGDLVVIVEVN